jgi:hypothetical protein
VSAGEVLYELYIDQFGGPFPIKWVDLDAGSRAEWNRVAKRFTALVTLPAISGVIPG